MKGVPILPLDKSLKRKGDQFLEDHDRLDKKQKDSLPISQSPGHRPVTSCTHCRQHKIKCNASERYPQPCQRCEKMNLNCEIDPQFRPKKGSQIQSLKNDVDELKSKIEFLTRNESLIAKALAKKDPSGSSSAKYMLPKTEHDPALTALGSVSSSSANPVLLKDELLSNNLTNTNSPEMKNTKVPEVPETEMKEFVLGNVKLPLDKANELHHRFVTQYLPYLPILQTSNCVELYEQSQLLFWTVILTACLSDSEPSLYISLASLIKQLAIETSWIRTPRSTHIIQALLILGTWPLPNQKVLDDCSYRFVGLSKNLSLQLGLHRGKFISEFSRTQVALANAEKWRTRTWLAVFFCEQFWSFCLGLPPSMQTDFLLEQARIDNTLPKNFRCLISLSIFQAKLVNVMGLSVTSPDGLLEPKNRAGALSILERELERLAFKLQIDDISVEIYYLYVQLMICCFAFLPETPTEDQTKYVTLAYLAATRIVTIISKMNERRQLIEYPIYVRQSVSLAVLVLFRLHLTPYLLPRYVDSARQSIVTVHRLFRNMLSAWKDVENDISRTATVLEKLNLVIITHPELFVKSEGIISRMRSHLTGSLFYDLVWCIHEARRRTLNETQTKSKDKSKDKLASRPPPLPFYNQITKEDFTTITSTTPNGTTITTLVPTDQALLNATATATAAGLAKPTMINGIPMAMLEATGSLASSNQKEKRNKPSKDVSKAVSNSQAHVNTPRRVSQNSKEPVVPKIEKLPVTESPFNSSLFNSQLDVNDVYSTASTTSSNNNPQSFLSANEEFNMNDLNNDQSFIDSIFQQQNNWSDKGDDFLGWLDTNMAPEF
ncbi:Putative transcription factor [Komagataella phaffii]|uniref:Transcription factor, has homolog in Kluyveromyces lactis n=1 Tax=Komagataella phaffii (strain GS115 / ATCC 20864) TaxID=644223 RepID=C4R5X8_KOMPG|nr:Putative transcription factor, has homolog in Kluyveromyces lactis [Komagataella phaffii GS115]AOA63631.1 GQ67_04030T0 [Komagataella phaffii]AOA68785.1 GQ68_04003T0 [Komagataella phaffii GS115]CAY70964.1 Putative transcription factor, has homolog in Kluyveromyces lactis [Komagataella phaffii GS115]